MVFVEIVKIVIFSMVWNAIGPTETWCLLNLSKLLHFREYAWRSVGITVVFVRIVKIVTFSKICNKIGPTETWCLLNLSKLL